MDVAGTHEGLDVRVVGMLIERIDREKDRVDLAGDDVRRDLDVPTERTGELAMDV